MVWHRPVPLASARAILAGHHAIDLHVNPRKRIVLEAGYVGSDRRVVVGRPPILDYYPKIVAVPDRADMAIRPAVPRLEWWRRGRVALPVQKLPDRICYKRVRRFSLAAEDSRRQDSPAASR